MTTPAKPGPWKRFVRASKKPVWYALYRLAGYRLEMPVHYLDAALIGGEFRLEAGSAAQLVSEVRFAPSVAGDGRARLQVTALQYREVDILYPYKEVALTIPGRLHGVDREEDLLYYLQLPVTTEDARWPGVEIYGFPKYVAAIEFEENEDGVTCSLSLDGEEILALRAGKGDTSHEEWQVDNLTFRQGEPVLSTFRAEGQRHASNVPGGAHLRLGPHRLAAGLRATGMELESVAHSYCPGLRAVLSKPVKL